VVRRRRWRRGCALLNRLQRYRWLAVGLAAVPTAVIVLAVVSATAGGSNSSQVATGPSRELTGPPPWPRNVQGLRTRLAALGLPALAAEGTALHFHVHLDLFVNGKHVTVPAGIGIAPGEAFFSPLHTHDPSGIVHIESAQVRPFTLGEFFGVWGVPLSTHCLGGYCATGARRLSTYVNGTRFAGDPARLLLEPHEEIVIAFGTRSELPRRIPSSYAFPPGL
jgi:hypothetical protein